MDTNPQIHVEPGYHKTIITLKYFSPDELIRIVKATGVTQVALDPAAYHRATHSGGSYADALTTSGFECSPVWLKDF